MLSVPGKKQKSWFFLTNHIFYFLNSSYSLSAGRQSLLLEQHTILPRLGKQKNNQNSLNYSLYKHHFNTSANKSANKYYCWYFFSTLSQQVGLC